MKKILVIDESALFREYLSNKFRENGFEVFEGKNGLEGMVRMRSEIPDLVIMDYYLSRKSSLEILKEKATNPNIADLPVIMVASKLDRSKLVEVARYKVRKFYSKPIKMETLLKTVSEILKVSVDVDATPCVIEAHLNDEIMLIEIARGLNLEKVELLRYKIAELLDLYDVKYPRVLLMMSDLTLEDEDLGKFRTLLDTIIEYAGPYARYMKILTRSAHIKSFVAGSPDFQMIEVTDNLSSAMDGLLGLRPDDVAHDEVVRRRLLSASAPKKEKFESFELRFDALEAERSGEAEGSRPDSTHKRSLTIGVVDDDDVIQELVRTVFKNTGWTIRAFGDGKEFVDELGGEDFDLVFLDLMMPKMNGFQVLDYMARNDKSVPVIVLSALSKQETVVKAMRSGVHSYLIKPFKPENLVRKAAELLNANF